jgi:hypothetical protein
VTCSTRPGDPSHRLSPGRWRRRRLGIVVLRVAHRSFGTARDPWHTTGEKRTDVAAGSTRQGLRRAITGRAMGLLVCPAARRALRPRLTLFVSARLRSAAQGGQPVASRAPTRAFVGVRPWQRSPLLQPISSGRIRRGRRDRTGGGAARRLDRATAGTHGRGTGAAHPPVLSILRLKSSMRGR